MSSRFTYFPRTRPHPEYLGSITSLFDNHEISTEKLKKGLTSDGVLSFLCDDLISLGFDIETGKKREQKVSLARMVSPPSNMRSMDTTQIGSAGSKLKQVGLGWETRVIVT